GKPDRGMAPRPALPARHRTRPRRGELHGAHVRRDVRRLAARRARRPVADHHHGDLRHGARARGPAPRARAQPHQYVFGLGDGRVRAERARVRDHGLQARPILNRLSRESLVHALLVSGAVLATVIVVRIAYVMAYNTVARLKNRWFGVALTPGTAPPTVAGGLLVSWCEIGRASCRGRVEGRVTAV